MTRAEHVAWAKARALEYVELGDAQQAVTSMLSDLKKHAETEELAVNMTLIAVFDGSMTDPEKARRFIEGFN